MSAILKYGYPVGLCILFFSFFFYIFSYLSLWVATDISWISFILAFLLSLGSLRYLDNHDSTESPLHPLSSLLISVVVFAIALFISNYFYDYSSDGQSYNQSAIIHLKDGWNFLSSEISSDYHHAIYLNGYCKGPWLLAAGIYELTNSLEAGKVFNLLFTLVVGLISLKCIRLLGVRKGWLLLTLAMIFAFDPINLNTLLSFTVDGQVSSFSKLLILGSVLMFFDYKKQSALILGIAIIYGLNIKFTILPFFVFYSFGFGIFLWVLKKFDSLKLFLITLSLSTFLGVCLFGINPYINNIKNHQTPFYPVYENSNEMFNNKPLADTYLPTNLRGDNNFTKLIKSTFAKTSFSKSFNKDLSYKIPFTFSISELTTYAGTGVMIGGLGVLFSGILLFTFLGVLLVFITGTYNSVFWKVLFLSLLILGSVVINPLSWWARFAPQFWLIPFIWCVSFIFHTRKQFQWLGKTLLIIIGLNSFLMTGYFVYNVYLTHYNQRLLEDLKNSPNELFFDFGIHESFKVKLKDHNIPFKVYSPADSYTVCKEITGTTTKYCYK